MRLIPGRVNESTPLAGDNFNGDVYVDRILREPGVVVSTVVFPPGTSTKVHRHEHGQLILIMAGTGQFGGDASETIRARPGDIVWSAPQEAHWHAADESSFLVQLAISIGETDWNVSAETAPGKEEA